MSRSKSTKYPLSFNISLMLLLVLAGQPDLAGATYCDEAGSRSVSYGTEYALRTMPPQQTEGADDISPSELKRRQECPVPCGYSAQLCCNTNEICYTAPNLQAECSATALPRGATTTEVQTTIIQHTQTVVTAIRITWNATVKPGNATVKTSLITLTSTSTATTSVVDPASSGNSTQPLTDQHGQNTGWSDSKKAGVIGGSIGGVCFLVLAFLLWRFCRNRRAKRNEKADFDDMQSDGAGTFRMVDTAHIREPSSSNVRPQNSTRSLQPKSLPFLFGRNPYEQPSPRNSGQPWGPDDVNGAPNPESRSSTPSQSYRNGQQGPGPSRQSCNNVPPPNMAPRRMHRRPVPGMQPTVEEEF